MLESKKNRKQDEVTPPSIPSSSPGDSPVAVTPKDVSPEHAAWKDLTARPIASDDVEKRTDALLDEASDLSFPASDPIAVSSIAWKDLTARPIASDDVEKRTDALLDEASDLSFPASDPIAVSSIAWKDLTARPIASDDAEKRTDALLDEASDLSFPASDPIAVSSITKLVKDTDADQKKADKDRSKNK